VKRFIAYLVMDYHLAPSEIESMTLSRLAFYLTALADLNDERKRNS